ncbi:MAG: hypothetical protein AB1696_08995 [Planctomycetota bacterium]
MKHRFHTLAILTALFCLHTCFCSADSVQTKWSALKRKLDYGKDGEFKGTLDEGNKLLGEIDALMKEAKDKNPPLVKIIDREADKLRDALKVNKMILTVENSEKTFNEKYETAVACQQKVKEMEQAQAASGKPFSDEELETMDQQWESCLKTLKTLRSSVQSLRKNCNRLAGQYERKWDEYERKVDQLHKIAEEARNDLRMRRQAMRKR